ncbi:MAG TPA: hypothetical protein VK045_11695 [Ornithinicoccus sp.]|nr:hypothetical protein [Ornithinicoccus sp.]
MASKVRIEMNPAGFQAILKSAEVQADLGRRAEAIANAAGDGMDVDVRVGRTRARASVRTGSPEAMRAEARDKTLTRAIDAGRG